MLSHFSAMIRNFSKVFFVYLFLMFGKRDNCSSLDLKGTSRSPTYSYYSRKKETKDERNKSKQQWDKILDPQSPYYLMRFRKAFEVSRFTYLCYDFGNFYFGNSK